MTEDENPKLRQGRAQEAWQRALGMRSFGTDRAAVSQVQLVSSPKDADLPIRGNLFTLRTVSPAFVGTHSYVRVFNRYGFRVVLLCGFNSPPLQIGSFAGGGVANQVNVDTFTAGTTDSGWYGRDGDERSFTAGPDFGWVFPTEDPFQVQTLTAGQHGPIVCAGSAVAGTCERWRLGDEGLTVYPLTPGGLADFYVLGQVPNAQIDVQLIIELPLRYPLRAPP